jgi:bifunctional UDP-N-acetylglucosamine pyrophosphorylase/glucosamine-1-phosphate N-acetyltransferase
MKAVIMAAGKSTRTYPLTLTRPKPLLPVLGKSILARQIEALAPLVEGVVIVVGYRQEMIRERFGSEYQGVPITYVEQLEQRGTGHAVLQCASCVDGPFLVQNGDDLYDPEDLARLAAADSAALAMEVPDPRLYGIYETTGDDRVVRLVEKPVEVFSNLANIGAYKLPMEVFDILRDLPPTVRGEIEVTSAVHALAETSGFHVVRTKGYWLPVGYPWHLLDVNKYFLDHCLVPGIEGKVSDRATISGLVHVGPGTVVRPGAVIDGPVYIGRDCTVGPNCWIRPYTVLCDGCGVGHASEIKGSVLLEDAHAPHQNYVGDSVIGAHANLACGTITANVRHDGQNVKSTVGGALIDTGRRKLGAILGDHVHTGINTSIYPGRKIWPNLSTRPGDVVQRDITG